MNVLILDDEKIKRITLRDDLIEANYNAWDAALPSEAFKILDNELIDVVVTDLRLPEMDGIEFLKRIKESYSSITVIMMTAYASVETAVEAMKLGAEDYISKPFSSDELLLKLEKIKRFKKVVDENVQLKAKLEKRYRYDNLIGKSHVMSQVFEIIEAIAPSNSTVLIYGETGTGKELVANAIHYNSPRRNKPLVRVSCAALSRELLESELFGHEKGAFTSAYKDKIGRFELAHTGSILLDEVDDIPYDLQVKLLRVLQEHEFERVGGSELLKVDVRVIAATKENLRERVASGQFRSDLFYRLNVVPIFLPPLRERKEDLSLLIDHFLKMFAPDKNLKIDSEALALLMDYAWPGNVRELENLVERLVTLGRAKDITADDIPTEVKIPIHPLYNQNYSFEKNSFDEIIMNVERELILDAYKKARGNKSLAAKLLKMKPSTYRDKFDKYNP